MSDCCGEHGSTATTRIHLRRPGDPITGDYTVGEAAGRAPGALAVIQELGLNHCCGAHLTLTQAAASAGVPVDLVLRRLNEVLAGPV
jgi:iron-sulfur cluster repair protein YtfE (RIC family)